MADTSTNTTTAIGLEGAIVAASKGITKIQSKIDEIFRGKYNLSKKDFETANLRQKIEDKGIVYLLDLMASIDLCNIINYSINQIPGGKRFDPNDPNKPTDPLGRAKWNLQYKAFQVQAAIDDYYTSYGDATDPKSKLGLQNLVKFVQEAFSELTNPEAEADFNNPVLVNEFPELKIFGNFLTDSLGVFNRYTDLRNIPNEDLQKIIQFVDKIKAICIAVQGLNSPTAIVGFANGLMGGKLQEEFAKINKEINPARIAPTLRNIVNTCNSIVQIARVVMNYVATARFIIRLAVLVIRVFKRIFDFLVAVVIPNLYTTLGITNKFSSVVNKTIVDNGIDNFVKRLKQVNAFLGTVVSFVTELVVDLQIVIDSLNALLLNLQGCDGVDPQIVKDLDAVRNNLISERQNLVNFVEGYNSRKKIKDNTFGGYTIKIVTEETVDIEFKIKRRHGIALDPNGNLAVESTPTYASLDDIIINEVKQILLSRGLVKSESTPENIQVINESLNFLEDNDINLNSLTSANLETGLDDPENENEDSGIGLNAFVNKLSGGKKLRKRVKAAMAQQTKEFRTDMASMKNG